MLKDHKHEAVAVLAGIGVGAALMYLLDPQRGNARRSKLLDQTGGNLRDARRDIEVKRRDLRNRAQGVAAEVRNKLSEEVVTDEQLTERVRAELGHHVDSLRRIEVKADNARVVLRGQVEADDRDEIIDTVRHVRGVQEVEDQMT